jgi:hypothetical protein
MQSQGERRVSPITLLVIERLSYLMKEEKVQQTDEIVCCRHLFSLDHEDRTEYDARNVLRDPMKLQ